MTINRTSVRRLTGRFVRTENAPSGPRDGLQTSCEERTAPTGPRDGLPNDAGNTAGSQSPASPRAAGTGLYKPTEQVFREALARIAAGFYTEKGAEQHAKDIIWLVDSQVGTTRPTAQPGRCKSMNAIQCTEVLDHDGDHCHETITWPNRCDVCHGSGEIVFNKHGGDPAFDESKSCPECAGSQS